MPIAEVVGRTNWILLALGLVGALALTLLMQQALHVHSERVVDPVAAEVNKTFGGRLSGPSRWRTRALSPTGRSGTLSLQPTVGVNEEKLARDAGDFVWRRVGKDFGTVLVICDSGVGDAACFSIPPPWSPHLPLTRVELPDLGPPGAPR